MAIIHSLICFGGRTGKTVTFTVSGSVVNLTNHGLRGGKGVAFTSTDTLPTGLTAGTIYYVRSTGLNTFTLHGSKADALANTGQVTFTTTGSGTHNVKGAYFLALTSGQLARYGSSGAERIYDSLASWYTARTYLATEYDEEWAEIGEAFTERDTVTLSLNMPSARTVVTPTIAGVPTEAFHGGVFLGGYVKEHANSSGQCILLLGYRAVVEGICIHMSGGSTSPAVGVGLGTTVDSCILVGTFAGKGRGILISSHVGIVTNNVVVGFDAGVQISQYTNGNLIAGNIAAKNNRGFYPVSGSTTAIYGYYYNNIAIGNTISNWHTLPSSIDRADRNAGASGNTIWVTGTGTTLTCTTDDFVGWANNDFRLKSTSALVDAGVAYPNMVWRDVAWEERPAYAGGAAEYVDVGPYECDLGQGPRPASHTLTLRNVAIGSRILIESQDGETVHYNDLASASEVVATITVYGDARDQWVIKVRKASESPFYLPWSTLTTVTAGESSIYVSQIPEE